MFKKSFLKKLSLFLSIMSISLVFLAPLASAANPNDNSITIQGTSKPDTAWNWSKGAYHFSGRTMETTLYSNYYFTNASQVRITVTNSMGNTTIKVLKSQIGIDFAVSSCELQAGQSATWTVALEPDRNYILKFSPMADFEGTIEKLA